MRGSLALNGATYALTFNLGAWGAVRRKGGKIVDLLGRFSEDAEDFDALQMLLWAMCWDNPSPPSFEDIGRYVTYENLKDVRARMMDVMTESLPEPTGGAREDARPTQSGTGVNGSDSATVPSPSSLVSSPS